MQKSKSSTTRSTGSNNFQRHYAPGHVAFKCCSWLSDIACLIPQRSICIGGGGPRIGPPIIGGGGGPLIPIPGGGGGPLGMPSNMGPRGGPQGPGGPPIGGPIGGGGPLGGKLPPILGPELAIIEWNNCWPHLPQANKFPFTYPCPSVDLHEASYLEVEARWGVLPNYQEEVEGLVVVQLRWHHF